MKLWLSNRIRLLQSKCKMKFTRLSTEHGYSAVDIAPLVDDNEDINVGALGDVIILRSYRDTKGGLLVETFSPSNNLVTRFLHLESINVKEGDFVPFGAKIGVMGNSGQSRGKHLHIEFGIYDGPLPLRTSLLNNWTRLDAEKILKNFFKYYYNMVPDFSIGAEFSVDVKEDFSDLSQYGDSLQRSAVLKDFSLNSIEENYADSLTEQEKAENQYDDYDDTESDIYQGDNVMDFSESNDYDNDNGYIL